MIGTWVGIIIFAIAGIIGAIICTLGVDAKAGKIGGAVACIVIKNMPPCDWDRIIKEEEA